MSIDVWLEYDFCANLGDPEWSRKKIPSELERRTEKSSEKNGVTWFSLNFAGRRLIDNELSLV